MSGRALRAIPCGRSVSAMVAAHQPSELLTLMVVHAHPDDEASSTGGILARYSAEGVRTVLVTCTDGAQGDGPGGIKPAQQGHDESEVIALRRKELRRSCDILGVTHLELLGYKDSGMMGWSSNDEPGSFWRTPIQPVAARLVDLFQRYRPQVVVSYDPSGFYGHPDHIQTHRVTAAAFEASDVPQRFYCPTVPRSGFDEFQQTMARLGLQIDTPSDGDAVAAGSGSADSAATDSPATDSPATDSTSTEAGSEDPQIFTSSDEDIAARIDCSAYTDQKVEALRSHASQADNVFFLRLPKEVFVQFFGVEHFVLWRDRARTPFDEQDLFSGLR